MSRPQWEIASARADDAVWMKNFLANGWEPFAVVANVRDVGISRSCVETTQVVWFRRLKEAS